MNPLSVLQDMSDEMRSSLMLNKDMTLKNNYWNWCLLLRHDADLRGRIRFDGFEHKPSLLTDGVWSPIDEDEVYCLAMHIAGKWGICPNPELLAKSVRHVSMDERVDPLMDYIQSLPEWDAEPRIGRFLFRAFDAVYPLKDDPDAGSEDLTAEQTKTLLSRLGECFMISAIARAMRPGCKADASLILAGPQGAGKSKACEALVPRRDWFNSSPIEVGKRDGQLILQGTWIQEIKELDSFKNKAATRIKAYLDEQYDNVRPLYAKSFEQVPRRCVFLGTTNETKFLNDSTGNRRYWVIQIGDRIDVGWLKENRDQMWAEAYHRFMAGEQWWLSPTEDVWLRKHNLTYTEIDPWGELIVPFMMRNPASTTTEILLDCIKMPRDRLTAHHKVRVQGLMKMLGYRSKQTGSGVNRRSVWRIK